MQISFPHGKDYLDTGADFDQLDQYIPTDVCHYTSRKTGLEKILSNQTVRLSRLVDTNDPRESKTRLYFRNEYKVQNGFWQKPGGTLEYKMMAEWRVLCLSCNKQPNRSFMNPNDRRVHADDHSMFAVGYSSMWAHYAEQHKGICILFNGQRLNKCINEFLDNKQYTTWHGFVKYNDDPRVVRINEPEFKGCSEEERIRKSLIKNYKDNFLYKSTQWKPEHEFRWLVQSKDSSELLIPVKDAITAVVVGNDFSKGFNDSIKSLCKPLGIPVFKVVWTNGTPFVSLLP